MQELDLTQPEIQRTVAALMSRHPAFTAHERFIAERLAEMAHRCYEHGAANTRISLLTTTQTADELRVSPEWVRRLAARHGVGWKADRDWIFQPADVEQLRAIIAASEGKPGPRRRATR